MKEGGRVLGSILGKGRDRKQDRAGVRQPHGKVWSWDGPAELPEWTQGRQAFTHCMDQLLTRAAPGRRCDLEQFSVAEVVPQEG